MGWDGLIEMLPVFPPTFAPDDWLLVLRENK